VQILSQFLKLAESKEKLFFSGKLIGKSGIHINKLKAVTNCNIILKDLTDTKFQQVSFSWNSIHIA
jgi:hypothetical protein